MNFWLFFFNGGFLLAQQTSKQILAYILFIKKKNTQIENDWDELHMDDGAQYIGFFWDGQIFPPKKSIISMPADV